MADIYFLKFPLVDSLGGAEWHTLQLASRFAAAGHSVKLITSDKKLLRLFRNSGLPCEYCFAGWEPTAKWSLLLWPATLLLARNRLEKIFSAAPKGSIFFLQSLTEKLILRRPGVVWLEHKAPGRWLKASPLLRGYLRAARNAKLVTVSHFARNEFLKLGVRPENIQVIYPGVKATGHNLIPNSWFTIGVLSRLDPEKGVYDLLGLLTPLFKKRQNWRMLIGGEGGEKNKIEQLIRRSGFEGQVALLGFITDKDAFFSRISVLAYPSNAPESFGLSALEAMAHGIPVVASKTGALPEIVEHNKTGFLIEPGPAPAWAAFLEKLADKNLRAAFGENARRRTREFSETAMFARFDQLIY